MRSFPSVRTVPRRCRTRTGLRRAGRRHLDDHAAAAQAISPEHAQCAIDNCDVGTAIGLRDRAVLLILARLGLRANEIITLQLEDCDWDRGHLRVTGRAGRVCVLPMPVDVGVYRCLSRARQAAERRSASVSALDGTDPRTSARLGRHRGSIVRYALERAGSTRRNAVRTSSVMRWPCGCCRAKPRWRRSAKCCAIAARSRPPSTRGSTSMRCVAWPAVAGRCAMNTLREALGLPGAAPQPGATRWVTQDGCCALRRLPRGASGAAHHGATGAAVGATGRRSTRQWARRLCFVRGFARCRSAVDALTEIPAGAASAVPVDPPNRISTATTKFGVCWRHARLPTNWPSTPLRRWCSIACSACSASPGCGSPGTRLKVGTSIWSRRC